MAATAFEAYLQVAENHFTQQRFQEALDSFRQAKAIRADDPGVEFGIGAALARLGYASAESHLRRALELDPAMVNANLELGRLFTVLKRKYDAIGAYEAALRQDPNNVSARPLLAKQLQGVKRYDEAMAIVARAVELEPNNSPSLKRYALLLSQSDQHETAIQYARRAAEFDATDPDAAYTLGLVLSAAGRNKEAIDAFNDALNRNPTWAKADKVQKELVVVRRMAEAAVPIRKRPSIFPSRMEKFEDPEKLVRQFMLKDFEPEKKLLTKTTAVSALGSCFAGHIAQRLNERGVSVFYKQIGEDINNTFANRFLLKWIENGPQCALTTELEGIYGADQRAEFHERFSSTGVFIFTLGVAPAFFDRKTGDFMLAHGGASENKLLPEIAEFRTTTVAENLGNLRAIVETARRLSPGAKFVITVSPVPLAATYEMGSAIVADCLSKSTLRLTVDQYLKETGEFAYYWPSYEIVRWLGPYLTEKPVFGADDGYSRHVSTWLVDMIMKLFIEYFGDETLSKAA